MKVSGAVKLSSPESGLFQTHFLLIRLLSPCESPSSALYSLNDRVFLFLLFFIIIFFVTRYQECSSFIHFTLFSPSSSLFKSKKRERCVGGGIVFSFTSEWFHRKRPCLTLFSFHSDPLVLIFPLFSSWAVEGKTGAKNWSRTREVSSPTATKRENRIQYGRKTWQREGHDLFSKQREFIYTLSCICIHVFLWQMRESKVTFHFIHSLIQERKRYSRTFTRTHSLIHSSCTQKTYSKSDSMARSNQQHLPLFFHFFSPSLPVPDTSWLQSSFYFYGKLSTSCTCYLWRICLVIGNNWHHCCITNTVDGCEPNGLVPIGGHHGGGLHHRIPRGLHHHHHLGVSRGSPPSSTSSSNSPPTTLLQNILQQSRNGVGPASSAGNIYSVLSRTIGAAALVAASGVKSSTPNGTANTSPLPPSPADSGVSDVDSHYSSNDEQMNQYGYFYSHRTTCKYFHVIYYMIQSKLVSCPWLRCLWLYFRFSLIEGNDVLPCFSM